MLNLNKILKTFFNVIRGFRLHPYFGFVRGHEYLSKKELNFLKSLIGTSNSSILLTFEQSFSNLIGNGYSVSFASGRMGFYALMRELGIQKGDEVVLLGSTCSVMVNAVIRAEAIPIYADIDVYTLGSSAENIDRVLTERTRMIVAQHSFGIPCDIERIALLAKTKGIFLLEDCALTVGSKLNGIVCGNFGDAALFSTDHTKPINTLSGGLIYTQNLNLYVALKKVQSESSLLSIKREKSLWNQLLLERKFCNPTSYGKMRIMQLIYSRILGCTKNAFVADDNGTTISSCNPYPAKIPTFLAALGIYEVKRWNRIAISRKKTLKDLLGSLRDAFGVDVGIYQDKTRNIVPLRLALVPKSPKIRNKLSSVIDVDATWFLKPIISTNEPLENFGYQEGACLKSEEIGRCIINLPCNISPEETTKLKLTLIQELKLYEN